MQPLNTSSIALSGINLVEASAGTGKTYALTELYLRLIIEKELLPESILVVTYTEAATKELRQKIRERIRDTTAMLASPLECTKRLASLGSLAMEKGRGRSLLSWKMLCIFLTPLRCSPFTDSAQGPSGQCI